MRRAAVLTGISVLLLAGCGGGAIVAPTAKEVVGTIPTAAPALQGSPANGKSLFAANGCGGCHTYKPANSVGKIGPDLDKLPQLAQKANQGSLEDFVRESIVNPSAYVEPGFKDVMPKSYGQSLQPKQIADLVAFLTQKK